ncbi:MAG TPA: hypothetical protein VFR26_04725 [Acidimicrobiales bacterium]|nr:hypothetical protein [Acidimicrobiales bacterium]
MRTKLETVAVGAGAATIGFVAWIAMMASAPRFSYGAQQDMGDSAFYPLLLIAAVLGGFLFPSRAALVGALLGLPGLALSPWTAPRGDNDGLWVLIIPIMVLFVLVLVATAVGGGWARTRLAPRPTNRA